jgi:hypothetical protein
MLVGLYCQGTLMGQLQVPFLSAEAFLGDLRLESPAVVAGLGRLQIACQTVVEGQCKSFVATGVLATSTSLLPLII